MHRPRQGWWTVFAAALGTAVSPAVKADPPIGEGDETKAGEVEAVVLPTVTVTGAGARVLNADDAVAGSVLLPEDFGMAGDSLPEVLDREAGVRITRFGGPAAFSTLSIRGSTAEQVLIVIDGIPLPSALGGPIDLSKLPLGAIERVEIYRGAAPLVFGQSAIGGVVSVTTRAATERELSVTAAAGSFAAREARLHYSEAYENWDAAMGIDYGGWGGDFTFVNDNGTRFDPSDDSTVVRRNNDFDRFHWLGKARLYIDESWTLTAVNWFFAREQGVPGLGQFETRKSRHWVNENLAVLSLTGNGLANGWVDVTARVAFHYSHSSFRDPLNEVGLSGDETRDDTYAPYVTLVGKLTPVQGWDITGQASYRFEGIGTTKAGDESGGWQRHQATAGVESGWLFGSISTRLIPSARVEWIESRVGDSDPTGQSRGSWRVAAVNQSLPDTRVSISGSRSLRFPSLFELFGDSGRVLGNSALAAEAAYSVDAAVIYDTKLGQSWPLNLEAYGYYSDVTDLIQYVQTAQNTARAENIDSARLWGVEAGLRTDLFAHLRLRGNYTFIDARNTGDVAARQDKVLPFRPASKWFVRAEGYVPDLGHARELALFADMEWMAGNYLDNANLVATSARLFVSVGVAVELSKGWLAASLVARNLLNEASADLIGYPLPGRVLHLSLTLRGLP